MKRQIFLLSIFCLIANIGFSQYGYMHKAIVFEGDTLATYNCKPIIIVGFRGKVSKKYQNRYNKLVRNVTKVYPYARLAAVKLKEYDNMLALISKKSDRDIAMKSVEKQLRKEYAKEIENLTFSQGLILIKLIDRETGKTSYTIVDDLRGKMRAFCYQALARLFKYDLKTQYDPKGKDKDIEQIVLMIEDCNQG
ncbi:MAG: DUF4294 domain-containing protein [Bacteroidales bacterium]|nr:DUF4294 domain-containing protein [Bacteroidales bacterium]